MRKVLKGKGVSNGIGFGKVVLLKPEDLKVEKSKIDNVKEETEKLEADYIEKEKQISTFLECKKTFFGKVKYFFKYSGKKKKKGEKEEKKEQNIESTNIVETEEIVNDDDEKIKRQYTLDDLLEKGKSAASREKKWT